MLVPSALNSFSEDTQEKWTESHNETWTRCLQRAELSAVLTLFGSWASPWQRFWAKSSTFPKMYVSASPDESSNPGEEEPCRSKADEQRDEMPVIWSVISCSTSKAGQVCVCARRALGTLLSAGSRPPASPSSDSFVWPGSRCFPPFFLHPVGPAVPPARAEWRDRSARVPTLRPDCALEAAPGARGPRWIPFISPSRGSHDITAPGLAGRLHRPRGARPAPGSRAARPLIALHACDSRCAALSSAAQLEGLAVLRGDSSGKGPLIHPGSRGQHVIIASPLEKSQFFPKTGGPESRMVRRSTRTLPGGEGDFFKGCFCLPCDKSLRILSKLSFLWNLHC